ncbi:adhesive plaque matrix protein isoform X7 [Labeo rohita]|uniref:adhesive plaque matrix protein isoform X7 n=1 Tax=Labeo rohita TaxID=84645 RepID=UPI0021E30235|nr:adhesive plaque matrix protein isoform X7 [Labeo rohita]
MAYWKIRESLLIILSSFTCITLIHCRSLLQFSGTEKNGDGGEIISEQYTSDHDEYNEGLADFDYLSEDPSVSDLQKKSIIKGQLVSSSEAAWDAMSPKLRCGDDLMKIQLSGPEVAKVELCRGNGAPVPLTQLPPHCGHTTPTYGGLVYATPYDGCGVAQKGGSYVMQMQWQGNSAVISCPVTSTTSNETFLGPHPPEYLQILLPHSPPDTPTPEAAAMPQPSDTAALKPPPPGYPQEWPYYYPYYHYPGRVYPTAKPTEKPEKPQPPGYPQMFWPYYYSNYHYHGKPKPSEKPFPASVPTATSVAQAPMEKPQLPTYPEMFWPYYYSHYYYHGKPKPTEIPVPTAIPTTTSAVAEAPPEKPQPPWYPHMFWPYYYPHYHGKPKPTEKPAPTAIPTTTSAVAQAPPEKPQPPWYPNIFWPYYYPHYHGKPKPTEVPAAQAPTEKPQLPRYPHMFWPYYYPHYHGKPKPTEKPAPTAIPTTTSAGAQAPIEKPQPPAYPGSIFPHYSYYPSYPFHFPLYPQHSVQPAKTPTAPPVTTTPQPCTTTAAAECKPFANQPPNLPPPQYVPPNLPPQQYIFPSSVLYENDPFALQFVDFSELEPNSFP